MGRPATREGLDTGRLKSLATKGKIRDPGAPMLRSVEHAAVLRMGIFLSARVGFREQICPFDQVRLFWRAS